MENEAGKPTFELALRYIAVEQMFLKMSQYGRSFAVEKNDDSRVNSRKFDFFPIWIVVSLSSSTFSFFFKASPFLILGATGIAIKGSVRPQVRPQVRRAMLF